MNYKDGDIVTINNLLGIWDIYWYQNGQVVGALTQGLQVKLKLESHPVFSKYRYLFLNINDPTIESQYFEEDELISILKPSYDKLVDYIFKNNISEEDAIKMIKWHRNED